MRSPNAEAYAATREDFGVSQADHVRTLFDRLASNGINYSQTARMLGITPRMSRMYRSTFEPVPMPYPTLFCLQVLVDEYAKH